GVARIGSRDAVLLDIDRMPVMEGDFAVHRAAGHASRAGILLAAAEAVRERVVGGDVVHGGGGLRVPVRPGLAAVGADQPTLVSDEQDDVAVEGVDPGLLVIVAPGCAADGGPGRAAVFGAPEDGRADIDHVRVGAIHRHGGEIAAADAGQGTGIAAGASPILAAIGGLHELDGRGAAAAATACSGSTRRGGGCDGSVEDLGIRGGDGEVGLEDGRQAASELVPGGAAVGGFEDAAAGAVEAEVFGEALLLLPECGVDDLRILRINGDVVGAGVLVLIEDLLERLAAIGGAEDAAFGVG